MVTDDWLKPLVDPSWDICIPQLRLAIDQDGHIGSKGAEGFDHAAAASTPDVPAD